MIPTMRVAIKVEVELKAFAPHRVSNADGKKEQCCSDVDQVGISCGQDANGNQETDNAHDNGSFFHKFLRSDEDG